MFAKKFYLSSWLVLLLPAASCSFAQSTENFQLHLKSGTITPPENLSFSNPEAENLRAKNPDKRFLIIQFTKKPGSAEIAALAVAGITLHDYIPNLAYTATITGEPGEQLLKTVHARAIINIQPEQKLDPLLLENKTQSCASKPVAVRLRYPASFTYQEVADALKQAGYALKNGKANEFRSISLEVPAAELIALAGYHWVEQIAPAPATAEPLLDKSTATTRANVLHTPKILGYSLSGEGVTVGIGDNASLLSHIDLRQRVIAQKSLPSNSHGLHVAGIVAGSGTVNERYTGYAPKATLISVENSEMIEKAAFYAQAFGMVITNNSYGSTSLEECGTFGRYEYSSINLDDQAFTLPFLQHVFAAGNSGNTSCTFPGFGTVFGEFASAKNGITVGQTAVDGTIAPTSSKGPTQDGRIKPEITAPGTIITSTKPNDLYVNGSGTSMAAPAVSGGLALLYQRYRQLNNSENPKNALMKAVLCNGATDRGLPGPDYSYGFGSMNLLRSVKMLDNRAYFAGSLANGNTADFQISVPGNVAAVKIMLYWNDPSASAYASRTLVNNLDLQVTGPDQATYLPLVPNQATPGSSATQTVDAVNNIEQVVVTNPAGGTYHIRINGTSVARNSQDYYVVYDFIEKATTLTYPLGGERLSKGDVVNLSWDANSETGSSFALSYSTDNGQSWTEINNAVSGDARQISWNVPAASTSSAKIRVQNKLSGAVSTSDVFTILGTPNLSLSGTQCETYAALQWTPVPDATDYEIMLLKGETMQPVATVSGLSYTFNNLSTEATYYFAVRARINGVPGRRSVAVSRKPDSGNCSGNISDRDLALTSIISPSQSGRMFTSTSLSSSQKVTIRLKNLDDQNSGAAVQVGYEIPGKSGIHWETINRSLSPKETFDYTFSKTVDLSGTNTYTVKVYVKQDGDPVEGNNCKTKVFQQIANERLTLPYFEDFESLNSVAVIRDSVGVEGITPFDFTTPTSNGRLSNRLAPALAYSGSNSLTFDSRAEQLDGNQNALMGTFNLAGYRVQKQEVKLSFRYRSLNTQFGHSGNLLFIRGSEKDPWILACDFEAPGATETDRDYKLISISLSQLLNQNKQEFSSSFQVKWSNSSFYPFTVDGYNIDDIRIFSTGGAALPVELLSFTAKAASESAESQDVIVDWATASEKDFDHFEIEAATEGEMRKGNFYMVASVDSRGAAGSTTFYSFLDKSQKAAETLYYRLKMVDTDGSTAYSTMRAVNFGGAAKWSVYPNPAMSQVFVDLGEKAGKVTQMQLLDISGKVGERKFTAMAGGKAGMSLPADLPPGSYLLKIISDNREETHRIVKK